MSTVDELLARYLAACQFSKPEYRTTIKVALLRWSKCLTGSAKRVLFANSTNSLAAAAHEAYARRAQTASCWKLDIAFGHWPRWHIRYARSMSGAQAGRDIFARSPARRARLAFDRWIRTVGQANYGCAQLVDTWLHVPGQSSWEPSDSSTALSTDFRQAWTVWDVAWEAITALGAEQVNDNAGLEAWSHLLDALEAGAWLLLLTGDSVVVATQPDLTCDTDARLHSEVGPAFKWNDIELWYWHGVNVWPTVVLHPESIELRDIMHYGMNAEVRRVLIERYGEGRFLTDSGADCLDDDPRFGVLWHKGVSHDEPLVFLELTNATPEPTGVYKHFWLRVPPTMHTAREAVAWTFGLNTGGYRPIIES